jgi:hypothetical protein
MPLNLRTTMEFRRTVSVPEAIIVPIRNFVAVKSKRWVEVEGGWTVRREGTVYWQNES